MRKDAIKIKDLARELGVPSRVLIDRCRAEGISVQNSITKLTPAQAERVRAWFAANREAKVETDPGKKGMF